MADPTSAPGTVPILPSDDPNGTPSADPNAPKLYAGKYKTVEEMEKGYKELEKKLGAPPATPAPAATPKPPATVVPPVPNAAAAAVADAGLNFEEFNAEFAQTGSLSPASYEKLSKSGIPKPIVDAYIDGQKAAAEKKQNEVFASVGGQEAYGKMIDWAAANLSEEEKIAFNSSLVGDVNAVKWAVAGLRQKYEAANGSEPNLVRGDGTAAAGGKYETLQQMSADMKDPRYKTDPSYRAAVRAKADRSTF